MNGWKNSFPMNLGTNRMQKEVISELFENKTISFSLNNTIVVDDVDTEVLARDSNRNLRRKDGCVHPKYSIILNTLNFPQSYMTNTVALTDEDNNWLSFSF